MNKGFIYIRKTWKKSLYLPLFRSESNVEEVADEKAVGEKDEPEKQDKTEEKMPTGDHHVVPVVVIYLKWVYNQALNQSGKSLKLLGHQESEKLLGQNFLTIEMALKILKIVH